VINAFRTPDDRRWYLLSLGLLIGVAWVVLVAWGASPYADLLDHGQRVDRMLAPGPRTLVFVLGWTLMTVALMLPSSLPLVNLFRRLVLRRPDGPRLVAVLLVGYLAVWVSFGLLAYGADGLLHVAVEQLPLVRGAAPGIGAVLLLTAGIYQFTPLKQMCLEKCRSPYMFLVQHWRGRQATLDALRLGMRHGLFCLGCCWSLMLLMFAVGGANLGWMLTLGVLMGAERTTGLGRHLTRPLGGALILGGLLVLAGIAHFPSD